MEPEHRPIVLIATDGGVSRGEFLLWEQSPADASAVRLAVSVGDVNFVRDGDEFFTALCDVRDDLETLGLVPQCYGASRNVYPSGMSREMGVCEKAYRLVPGIPGQMADLVNIFDDGPDVDPVSVSVQQAFFEDWTRSLGHAG